MAAEHPPTGYGPRKELHGRFGRLIFDGDERKYETWEIKFLGYMRLQKLKSTLVSEDEPEAEKNEEAFAELIQFLDDKSLSLVMRDAQDDGRKALNILRTHYAGKGKPRIISLYTELTSLIKSANETVTDYVIRAETTAAALRNAEENVSDSLLIAMALKGLPESYKPFVVVVTQSDKQQTFIEFKEALRSFEDTERARAVTSDDSIMKTYTAPRPVQHSAMKDIVCYRCGLLGTHIARNCKNKPKNKMWCSHCQSSTHTDNSCRRKGRNNTNKVKQCTDGSNDESEHSFAFKVKASDILNHETTGKLLVDCGATTHIITDESKFTRFDESFKPERHYIELADGTRSNNVALKRGDVSIDIVDTDGRRVNAELKKALYIPSYPQDIFSVQAATEKGASVVFQPNSAELIYKDGTKFNVEKQGRLYYLNAYNDSTDSVNYTQDVQSWHEILGHCNYEDVMKLQSVVDGMKIKGKPAGNPSDCSVCTLGKLTQNRNRKPDARASVPLELVHTDLAGPIDPVSREGFRYGIAFTDDYSGAMFVYFMKAKSDTVAATERFLADSAPYGTVKCIRSDNGTEFTSNEFKSLLRKNRIRHDTSAPYSPHQNGTAERHWRTLFEMGRCLLVKAKLPKEMWPYAIMASAYIRNRCFNDRLKQTPYFALTGRKPNLSNMRVFGSECYAYKQDKKKLDTRCTKGIFVGYDKGSPAYLVYFPETGKVLRYRIVKFTTRSVVEQHTQTDNLSMDDDDDIILLRPNDHDNLPEVSNRTTEAAAAQPENENGANAEFVDGNVRYPRRERKPPAYLRNYVGDFEEGDQVLSSIDYCYAVSNFPQTYKEAIESPDSEYWQAAMRDEMDSLNENQTFTLTTLPEGRQLVGGRWVYTIKENSDGSKSYKARYVAKGYSQIKGVDYEETFAPTTNFTSVRALMQMAAQYDLILHQMDVKTAYLNAPIDCEIYMEQAEGFKVPSEYDKGLVYKLNKSLYGLKQSGRNWNNLLHSYLLENNYEQNCVDPCVYVKRVENGIIVILVWVDDLIIAASNNMLLSEVKQMLKNRFHMKDLGRLSYCLGMDFEQSDGIVRMNQKRYILKILERFDMSCLIVI